MRILYGVQGTGNGHISRANALAAAFAAQPELQVDWLLSGRPREQGCGAIRQFQWRPGVTFKVERGRVDVLATLRNLRALRFLRDVRDLPLEGYDLVISDYEPVVSHAARRRGLPVLGIGHQYAFHHDIPLRGDNVLTRRIMRAFAPATLPVGLHWHHFGAPILPPILDLDLPDPIPPRQAGKVLVYLPFEDPASLLALFRPQPGREFVLYHPGMTPREEPGLAVRGLSRQFKAELATASRVVCNAGFELITECLHLGIPVLAKPVQGQMEQLSNAQALRELGYAQVMENLEPPLLAEWLDRDQPGVQRRYADVAQALAAWIATGCLEPVEVLAERLWRASGVEPQARLRGAA